MVIFREPGGVRAVDTRRCKTISGQDGRQPSLNEGFGFWEMPVRIMDANREDNEYRISQLLADQEHDHEEHQHKKTEARGRGGGGRGR